MKLNIFVIDDDEISNYMCHVLFKAKVPDANFASFVTPVKFLDYIKDHPLEPNSIILLDLNMPLMDGWEFLDECEKKIIKCNVFILTSSIDPSDAAISKKYPKVFGYFCKPLTLENIEYIIKNKL